MNENKKLTLNSKVGELYETPVGHDTIAKVLMQLGLPEKAITNFFVSNLKLKTLAVLTKPKLGEGFFDALLHLINSEKMYRSYLADRSQRNGGRKRYFIRFIREAFMIPMEMASVIFRESLKSWII